MTFVSNAQNYEDVLLWRALRDVERGRYLDVGAHDPIVDSVSLAFYEAGWRGVHVEPLPFYAARLREARTEDCVIEAAVTDAPGPILFHELGGLSSGRADVVEHHARAGHFARQIFVPTVRLDELLKLSDDDIHWLKIDVEGMEADVLRSWGESRIRPWILVIESTFPNTQQPTHDLWIDEVLRRDYCEVHFDGLSRYFLHESQVDRRPAFESPPNIFDGFAVARHHFSAAAVSAELEVWQLRGEQLQVEATAAREASEAAINGHAETMARLAAAEEAHRTSVDALLKDRQAEQAANRATLDAVVTAQQEADQAHRIAEQNLRRKFQEREDALRERSREAELAANALRVELARLAERSAQLQVRLWSADELVSRSAERAAEWQRQAADARAALQKVERERSRAAEDAAQARTEAEAATAHLNAEMSLLRAELARVNTAIQDALDEPEGRWEHLGRTLGLFPPRKALQTLANAAAPVFANPASNRQSQEEITSMASTAPVHAGNPYLRANSLGKLLSWRDVDFVRCAYVTVLGRQPDPEGEAYYTDRIRSGHSKMEVLWNLRRSPEGLRHDPGIAGLDKAIRRARMRSWPLRVLRRIHSNASQSQGPTELMTGATTQPPLRGEENQVRAVDETLASEVASLKAIVDGYGHAMRGIAAAQARHERLIKEMQSQLEPVSVPKRVALRSSR